MGTGQGRLDLRIDVFDEKQQRALALPDLTPPELVEAVLQEFRELPYLGDDPTAYKLVNGADGASLDNEVAISYQVRSGSHLVLQEADSEIPEGAKRPSLTAYLRELVTGQVYRLDWIPAIIGRPDNNQAHNDRVAVNLETYPTGLRVSRRHAQIIENGGQFYIQNLSRNPTHILRCDKKQSVDNQPLALQDEDTILLDRSNITLKFIQR